MGATAPEKIGVYSTAVVDADSIRITGHTGDRTERRAIMVTAPLIDRSVASDTVRQVGLQRSL
ncbi:hypothetical protein [Halosolutus halophilus]|uniref:hypothetical protein n=1 Tax=Halosolutus halophilus TaxID=1552990 RepID=UPI0022350015|nr:hypothetical protein [Halosolutus halophilus]